MPTLRNAQSNAGATRLYDDNRTKSRATPVPEAQCPKCRQKNTVGSILDKRYGWYFCWRCDLEFNVKSGKMQRITSDGEVKPVRLRV